jgi:predicted Zn-dependent peptidase
MLLVAAIGKPRASADSLEQAVIAEVNSLSGFTQAELDRIRASARFRFVNALQSTGGLGGRADRLAEGWTYFHDPNHVNGVLSAFDKVTVADLNALAAERLVPANRAIVVFVPARKTPPSVPSGT